MQQLRASIMNNREDDDSVYGQLTSLTFQTIDQVLKNTTLSSICCTEIESQWTGRLLNE